jgi:tetratricopeptide (TPR) repeat protein
MGNPEQGVDYIRRALTVKADFPEAYYNLGNALLSLQRPDEALTNLDRAIQLNPKDPQYHFERGNALKEMKRVDEALASFAAAIRLFPGYAEAHNNIGIVLKEAERFDEALRSYDAAIRLRPGYAEAHGNRGNVLKELDRLNEAMASYDQAIRLKPDYAEAYSNRGNALTLLKFLDDALASHDLALALRPDYAEGHNNRANVLKELGRLEEALASYDRAIALRPDYAEAHSNRGNALKEMKRVDEAMASHARALSLQPGYAEAYNNIGNLLKDMGQVDKAIAHYEEAARLKPAFTVARYNKSLLALQRHFFRDGFDHYRLRWEVERNDRGPQTAVPQWDGTPLPGEVLLWAEQGIGDEVFFASMLSLLDLDTMKFALSADKRLHPIYQRSFPGIRLVDAVSTRTSIAGDYAAQAAIGDLGHILQLDAERIARRRSPYLFADAARTAQLRTAIDIPEGNIVCGLSWKSGNKKAGGDRSIELSDLAPLLAVPGITFVNLQYGDVAAEVEAARVQSGADLRIIPDVDVFGDIDGLLALIDLCDMVVTIDNLTAHLAGAIGKHAGVLVPTGGGRHWYWGGERQSLWYPSLQLLYQQAVGDWGHPIREASQLLGRAGPAQDAST